MRPDEANDSDADATDARPAPEAPAATEAGPPGSTVDERPAAVDDRDEGGDPACWIGLIDDQRDHQ